MYTLGDFLLWAAAVYGTTFGIKDAKLSEWPRRQLRKLKFFDELLSCSFCTGFWSGVLVLVLHRLSSSPTLLQPQDAATILLSGFAGAAASYTIDLGVQLLEQKVMGDGPTDSND